MTRSAAVTLNAAAVTAMLTVALGAFGAHGLDGRLDTKALGWWDTATFYLLTHAIAAFAVGLSKQSAWFQRSAQMLLVGAAVFALTLYSMALGAPRWFGAITPLGGLLMLCGWALMVVGGLRSK